MSPKIILWDNKSYLLCSPSPDHLGNSSPTKAYCTELTTAQTSLEQKISMDSRSVMDIRAINWGIRELGKRGRKIFFLNHTTMKIQIDSLPVSDLDLDLDSKKRITDSRLQIADFKVPD
ncbi:hypothetical protein CEXT_21371 [Caerostris extrusa]|uniref:Uncharacterized protein n=1 Tax=Caerostris extrusa TaxID=172846 RepID=A0AAV4Q8X7_CAEEX|nr:hypothetical protein CEXT_21371 [Caerostris extrusa]